jgi:hypothetical protein
MSNLKTTAPPIDKHGNPKVRRWVSKNLGTARPGAGRKPSPPRRVGDMLVVNVAHLTGEEIKNGIAAMWYLYEIERNRRKFPNEEAKRNE